MISGGRTERLTRRVTVGDIVLAVLLAAASAALWRHGVPGLSPGARPRRAEVVSADGGRVIISLGEDGRRAIPGPLGDSEVEVRGGRIRMRSSPCPNQVCVREGWKDAAGQVIVCAPNRVVVMLPAESGGVDAVSR